MNKMDLLLLINQYQEIRENEIIMNSGDTIKLNVKRLSCKKIKITDKYSKFQDKIEKILVVIESEEGVMTTMASTLVSKLMMIMGVFASSHSKQNIYCDLDLNQAGNLVLEISKKELKDGRNVYDCKLLKESTIEEDKVIVSLLNSMNVNNLLLEPDLEISLIENE